MKLYGTPPTRALRAIWLIYELEIDCEILEVDMGIAEHKSPQMLALNPTGKLPFLVDGDDVISESCAIQLYLAEKYSEKGFMGANLSERGQIYRWMFFLATEIEQPLWRVGLHTRMSTCPRGVFCWRVIDNGMVSSFHRGATRSCREPSGRLPKAWPVII